MIIGILGALVVGSKTTPSSNSVALAQVSQTIEKRRSEERERKAVLDHLPDLHARLAALTDENKGE